MANPFQVWKTCVMQSDYVLCLATIILYSSLISVIKDLYTDPWDSFLPSSYLDVA